MQTNLVERFQDSNHMGVIPGLGRSEAKAESPESILPICGYGFRARRSASLRPGSFGGHPTVDAGRYLTAASVPSGFPCPLWPESKRPRPRPTAPRVSSRRLGVGMSPSRWACLRAALRARRMASAFSRVLRSDGFSYALRRFISRKTPSRCIFFLRTLSACSTLFSRTNTCKCFPILVCCCFRAWRRRRVRYRRYERSNFDVQELYWVLRATNARQATGTEQLGQLDMRTP